MLLLEYRDDRAQLMVCRVLELAWCAWHNVIYDYDDEKNDHIVDKLHQTNNTVYDWPAFKTVLFTFVCKDHYYISIGVRGRESGVPPNSGKNLSKWEKRGNI